MKDLNMHRAYLATPLYTAAARSGIDLADLAKQMNSRESYLSAILRGERECSLDKYIQIANHLGMHLSLVPVHLARGAVLDAQDVDLRSRPAAPGHVKLWISSIAKTLRNHRIKDEAIVAHVSDALGNSTHSFQQFQNGMIPSVLPGLQTVQKYAGLFNLALVAVGNNSEYGRHQKADFAKTISYRTGSRNQNEAERTSIDHELGSLLKKVTADPRAYGQHFNALSKATPKLKELEAKVVQRPQMIRMPPAFAAAVMRKMEVAREKGFSRTPYAEVVKPWGDPKSWSIFAAKESFDRLYRTLDSVGARHASARAGERIASACKEQGDLPIGAMMKLMHDGSASVLFEAQLPSGDRLAFAASSAPEIGFVVQQLVSDRPISPITKETTLSKQSIDSLIAHPEENRMSTLLRLLDHFGIEASAVPTEEVMSLRADPVAEAAAPRL